jgi:DNA-binding protein Fis
MKMRMGIHLNEDTLFIADRCYQNFVNAIKSPATRRVYKNSLKRYMKHLKITEVNQLLDTANTKVIEAKLIDYIMSLRQDGLSHAFMKHAAAPIITFYQLNDIILNRKKINRYFGEYKKVTKDKAYISTFCSLFFALS